MANKEQKRSTREVKKPKQKKKTAEKRSAGKGHAGNPDSVRKGREETRGQGAIEHDKDTAIVGAADQPAIGLAQPQPGNPFAILRSAKDRLASAMQDVGARPWNPVEDEQAQRTARDIDAVAHCVGAEQAGILFGAKNVDQGGG